VGEIQEARKANSEQQLCCANREEVRRYFTVGQENGETHNKRWRSCEDRCCSKSTVG
jgi:hypothetical protein